MESTVAVPLEYPAVLRYHSSTLRYYYECPDGNPTALQNSQQ